eukprot:CAMPEP_0180713200 /NCGR_PEP_ID=MMETSP1038_2-20121128/11765_1 /TAXON_ID=632150 /ORGANISM="Azadinium spinosum, Strain 3D9" /LENGTH=226 /DNA_ID=CAMNT_0022745489 /DNA_START=58 /DNA_END=735 /DNA_ORIENTATION=+
MTVSWSINTLAIKKLVRLRPSVSRCDEQAEIQSLGLSNMCLGLLGCHPSMQSFKIPILMQQVGATHVWPFFNLVTSCVIFFCSPRLIVKTVPRFLFAGTVVRLACDLIDDWLVQARKRIALKEWWVLALTALVTYANVTIGIFMGLFLTLILFAVEYSSITGVARTGSLRDYRSVAERSDVEDDLLREHGLRVRILWLSGYFFFGSATHVADEVSSLVADPGVSIV